MRECEITSQVMIKTEQLWPHLDHGIKPFCFHKSTRILQARILKWVAILFYKGTSRPRDQNQVSCTEGRFFTTEPPGTPYRFPDHLNCSHTFPAQIYLSWSKETRKQTHFLYISPPFTSHLKFRAYTCLHFFFYFIFKLYNIVLVLPKEDICFHILLEGVQLILLELKMNQIFSTSEEINLRRTDECQLIIILPNPQVLKLYILIGIEILLLHLCS